MNTVLSRCLFGKLRGTVKCCCQTADRFLTTKASSSPTYFDLYKRWVQRFEDAKIPEPRESAGYITAHLLGKKTFSVTSPADLAQRMSDSDEMLLDELCHKRLERMPVQYIIGEWDFFGINLKMKPPVFIPRPETEGLARYVLQDIHLSLEERKNSDSPFKVLEIGCGTGAIALSLLDKLRNQSVELVAIDAAEHAVRLTKENAEILGLAEDTNKLRILHHTLSGNVDALLAELGPFDVIVSNPPYIPSADMRELPDEIIRYEDESALLGGETGLDVIDNILKVAQSSLTKNGSVWLEVDSTHPPLMKSRYEAWVIQSRKDVFGKERFCHFSPEKDVT